MIYQGTNDPNISALGGTYKIPSLTTTEKDASSPDEGALIYDITLHKLCVYTAQAGGAGTGWETITSALE